MYNSAGPRERREFGRFSFTKKWLKPESVKASSTLFFCGLFFFFQNRSDRAL